MQSQGRQVKPRLRDTSRIRKPSDVRTRAPVTSSHFNRENHANRIPEDSTTTGIRTKAHGEMTRAHPQIRSAVRYWRAELARSCGYRQRKNMCSATSGASTIAKRPTTTRAGILNVRRSSSAIVSTMSPVWLTYRCSAAGARASRRRATSLSAAIPCWAATFHVATASPWR